MLWIDSKIYERSKAIIPGLLRKNNMYKAEICNLQRKCENQEIILRNLKAIIEEREKSMEMLVEELEIKCNKAALVHLKDAQVYWMKVILVLMFVIIVLLFVFK